MHHIYSLLISITTQHKAPHFSFNSPCACVHSKSACASVCKYVFFLLQYSYFFFYINFYQFMCLCVYLFVYLAATLLRSLYLVSVLTVIVSFDVVILPLFSSIITHHCSFYFFICPLWENSRHSVRAAWSIPTRSLYG